MICVPGRFPTADDPRQTAGVVLPPDLGPRKTLTILESQQMNSIAWPDATSLYKLAGFMQAHGQRYSVRRERDTALSDLRSGPVVLIGGFNNQWLMRLTSRYRFTYQSDFATGDHWIHDSQNPSKKEWKVNIRSPYASFEEDFGIISRVRDASTERWVVVASGIASYGTIAAGEFLTKADYLALLGPNLPADWKTKNLQVVFATKVFNGYAAPPRIRAVHVW